MLALRVFLIVTAVLLCTAVLVFSNFGESRTVIYDCREAHWHPDYPVKVKEECRRLMNEFFQKEQKIPSKNLTTA